MKAVAYCRTSSAANVGEAKDSLPRQLAAIERYAAAAGFEIVDRFYDPAVSGADPIEERPGFAAMLERIEGNGVRTVLVEDASRFARTVLAQELGVLVMAKRGVRVVTTHGEDLTETEDASRKMMRQVAAAFAEYEKSRLVARLRRARDKKRAETGRCEGPKPVPAPVVAEARRLARRSPKTGQRRSLRAVGAELAKLGHVGPSGQPYGAESVKRMLARG
jgi:DNA invertase Pin-like site-specific DNA recombinase